LDNNNRKLVLVKRKYQLPMPGAPPHRRKRHFDDSNELESICSMFAFITLVAFVRSRSFRGIGVRVCCVGLLDFWQFDRTSFIAASNVTTMKKKKKYRISFECEIIIKKQTIIRIIVGISKSIP